MPKVPNRILSQGEIAELKLKQQKEALYQSKRKFNKLPLPALNWIHL